MIFSWPDSGMAVDRKRTRPKSSHTEIYTLSLHDALPIYRQAHVRVFVVVRPRLGVAVEPRPDDLLVRELRDADLGEVTRRRVAHRREEALLAALHRVARALLHHPVAGLEAHLEQRRGGRLELLDLGRGEVVIRPLL